MRSFDTFLYWIYCFTCLVLVGAKESLRGRTATDSQNKKAELLPVLRLMKRKLNVIGPDNRQVVLNPLEHPLSAVGKVFTSKGTCTGVMVGPSLMLTAQSCVGRDSDNNLGWLRFIPAYHESSSEHGAANSLHVFWDQDITSVTGALSARDVAFNYMVAKLDRPLGNVVGYWNTTVYDRSWNGKSQWAHIGYANDISDGQSPIVVTDDTDIESVQSYFASDGTESYLMKTTIDFAFGQMGGPVFGFFTDSNNVTSINIVGIMSSASATGKTNTVSGGPGMVAKVEAVRNYYADETTTTTTTAPIATQDLEPKSTSRKYATYSFGWTASHEEENLECKEPGPAPQLKCSGNGSIQIAKHVEENHDCIPKENDQSALVCGPQPDVGMLLVRCYGSGPNDIKLTVTLPEITARCHGKAGGHVLQAGLVKPFCGNDDDGKYMDMKQEDCLATPLDADTTDGETTSSVLCYSDARCQRQTIIERMSRYCDTTVEEVVMITTRDLEAEGCIYAEDI